MFYVIVFGIAALLIVGYFFVSLLQYCEDLQSEVNRLREKSNEWIGYSLSCEQECTDLEKKNKSLQDDYDGLVRLQFSRLTAKK